MGGWAKVTPNVVEPVFKNSDMEGHNNFRRGANNLRGWGCNIWVHSIVCLGEGGRARHPVPRPEAAPGA